MSQQDLVRGFASGSHTHIPTSISVNTSKDVGVIPINSQVTPSGGLVYNVDELKTVDSRIEDDAMEAIKHINSMNARKSLGGTSEESVLAQIKYFEDFLQRATDEF